MTRARRRGPLAGLVVLAALALGACSAPTPSGSAPATPEASAEAEGPAPELVAAIRSLTEAAVERRDLASVLVQVRIDGDEVVTIAEGEAMAGVPVVEEARFRNGAVAITYLAAIVLRLAEEGTIGLDDPISTWLPELPEAEHATPRMLLSMTSGYPDYVRDARFEDDWSADVFRAWEPEDLIEYSLTAPRLFAPGENWDYSHSGIVILGRVLERATGRPLAELMREYVVGPLGLTGTVSDQTAVIPEPAVHGFDAERGLYEDATFWNPSWTLARGSVQTTTIEDMARSFDEIVGSAEFLGEAAHAELVDQGLVGFGAPLAGCGACHTLTDDFSYGLGVFTFDDWVAQTPLFGGYASTVMTLPEERSEAGRVTVAVAVTMQEDSYADWSDALPNWANELAREIATELVPENPPPPFHDPTP